MSMNTNLHGRVRHTKLSKTNGLLPLFEAVVNSIHSSEEAGLTSSEGEIIVEILRRKQNQLSLDVSKSGPGREAVEDILGFNIIDNGVGFNDVNMESFTTLDSEHKVEKGCRGVGRLIWLKAFQKVRVTSNYYADDVLFLRSFDFSAEFGVINERNNVASSGEKRRTVVHLDGFVETYRDASRRTVEAIAKSLFEHCLWYFVRPGGAPSIVIKDDTETILLDDTFEMSMHSSAKSETISIKDIPFELTHIKLQSNSIQSHAIAFCAASRVVKEENIKGEDTWLVWAIR